MFLIEGGGKAIIYTGDIRGKFCDLLGLMPDFESGVLVGKQSCPAPGLDSLLAW